MAEIVKRRAAEQGARMRAEAAQRAAAAGEDVQDGPEHPGIVEAELSLKESGAAIVQEIVRFLRDHPAARLALASNFPEGSAAQRIISLNDEIIAARSADPDGAFYEDDLSPRPDEVEEEVFRYLNDDQEGIGRPAAISALAQIQERVWKLTDAKGALQRALATQGEVGTGAPGPSRPLPA